MLVKRPFHVFTEDDTVTWKLLFDRQYPQAMQYATRWYKEGMDLINLRADRIPDFEQLSSRFKELVDWELVSTDVVYSDGQDWFLALEQREFLITEYIRERKDLEYTPLPDIWHDAFGHLPFMAIQRYADYLERFARHAIKYPKQERKSLGSLWWYSIEFGLLMEDGEMKALGAGLMSSYAELKRVYEGKVNLMPYSLEAFENLAPSPHEFHNTLFIFDSWEQIEQSVEDWVKAHPPK